MTKSEAEKAKSDLMATFHKNNLSVAVGLTKPSPDDWGVAIRSQTPEVDAQNIGIVRPQ